MILHSYFFEPAVETTGWPH